MIADAIATAITLGWALAGWIVALAALCTIGLLGTLALTVWAWTACTRALSGPSWARGRLRARIHARRGVRASDARTGLQAPRERTGSPATGPSRRLNRRQTASQASGAAFPAPASHTAPQSHTADPDHHTHQEAA